MSSFRSYYHALRISLLVTFFLLQIVILFSSAVILAPVKSSSQKDAAVALTTAIIGSVFGILFFLLSFIRVIAPYSGFFVLVAWEICWLTSSLLMQTSTLVLIGNPRNTFCTGTSRICRVGEGVVTTSLALVLIFTATLLLGDLSRCHVHRHYGPQWWYIFRSDVAILGRKPMDFKEGFVRRKHAHPDPLFEAHVDADAHFHEVPIHDSRASRVYGMYPAAKQAPHSGKVVDTGYDRDHRPSWARVLSIARGRDHPYPQVPPQAKPKMTSRRPDEPVSRAAAIAPDFPELKPPPVIYSNEKHVPSLLFAGFTFPRSPSLVPGDSASNIYAPSDVSSVSVDLRLYGQTPARKVPYLREMPSRTTVWSRESWVPGDDGAVLPPLPIIDQDLRQLGGSWSIDHEDRMPPPIPTKDVTKTKPHSAHKSTKRPKPRDTHGKYWVQRATDDHDF